MFLAAVQPGGRMVFAGLVFLAVALVMVLAAYSIGVYNELVLMRRECDEEWADVAALINQFHDELPKLIDLCKGCMESAQKLVMAVTDAHTASLQAKTPEQQAQADGRIADALKALFHKAADHPGLNADANFIGLQGRLRDLKEKIASQRAAYNMTARAYNLRIAQVPANFVASLVGFETRATFPTAQPDAEDADVSFA